MFDSLEGADMGFPEVPSPGIGENDGIKVGTQAKRSDLGFLAQKRPIGD